MDLQLNISAPLKVSKAAEQVKKTKQQVTGDKTDGYSFVSNPILTGKTFARKRRKDTGDNIKSSSQKPPDPKHKKIKHTEPQSSKNEELSDRMRELSENKGKYLNKDYQALNDDLQIKLKPRTGGWISSLFKNNPTVPHMGSRAIKPIVEKVFSGKTFADLDIHPHSVANLQQNLKLKELMTVQQKASPIILQGRDVLVRSQTGSGKTLAYALPIIEGLQAIRPKITRHDGIRVVVVVPTRELAVQTYELFVKLVKPFTWIVPGLLSGGQKRKAEKARLRKGLSILVGTPGRINDHLRHTKSLNFSKTRCLVLDEADRLLDMGYEKDVSAIVEALSNHKKAATYDPLAMVKQSNKKTFDEEAGSTQLEEGKEEQAVVKHHLTEVFLSDQRQTVLLSATLTKAVENLAGLTMVDPVFVDTSEGRAVVVADSLMKVAEEVPVPEKKKRKKGTLEPQPEDAGLSAEKIKDKLTKKVSAEMTKDEERLGLSQFDGSRHLDLFKPNEFSASIVKTSSKAPAMNDESDSDSDYEYFKVQKQIASQKKEESCSDEETEDAGNDFQEAIQTAVEEDELVIPVSVVQKFLITPMKLRLVTLCAMIVEHCVLNKKGGKMIVFMATTEMVDFHADLLETVLTEKGKSGKKQDAQSKKSKKASVKSDDESSAEEVDSDFEVSLPGEAGVGGLVPVALDMFKLHGNMLHSDRIDVFNKFRAARSGLLICTDVAARGLDLPRVDLVLQYCAPASATDYVHRVGRTGRATHVGAATLLLLPSEAEFVRYLEEKRIRLRQEDDRSVLDSLRSVVPGASGGARAAVATQACLEHVVTSSRDWLSRASRAYTSWVRFYAGYPRPVRPLLDARVLHLGHAAKAFALRDAPGAVGRRARADPAAVTARPTNRLTVERDGERRRPGFGKAPPGGARRPTAAANFAARQSSMHTASEFDSGLPPPTPQDRKRKK